MLIWSGNGFGVAAMFAVFAIVSGWFLDRDVAWHSLHMAIVSVATGLFWLLFLKSNEKNKERIAKAEQDLLRPELLDDKARKHAERWVKSKAFGEQMDNSTLFFIHVKWWHYIMFALSLMFLGFYFFG